MVGTLDTTTDLYVCMSINEYYSSMTLPALGSGGCIIPAALPRVFCAPVVDEIGPKRTGCAMW